MGGARGSWGAYGDSWCAAGQELQRLLRRGSTARCARDHRHLSSTDSFISFFTTTTRISSSSRPGWPGHDIFQNTHTDRRAGTNFSNRLKVHCTIAQIFEIEGAAYFLFLISYLYEGTSATERPLFLFDSMCFIFITYLQRAALNSVGFTRSVPRSSVSLVSLVPCGRFNINESPDSKRHRGHTATRQHGDMHQEKVPGVHREQAHEGAQRGWHGPKRNFE